MLSQIFEKLGNGEKFWSRAEKPNACWLWKGAKKKRGYGNVKVSGKVYSAHVLSWMLSNQSLPTRNILHSCDNPSCVNPAHLREGTHLENMRDMRRRGRASKRLTLEQVTAIRTAQGTHRQLAELYGVSHRTIGQIRRGDTWQ